MKAPSEQAYMRPRDGTAALVLFLLSLLVGVPLAPAPGDLRSDLKVEAVGVQMVSAVSRSDERLSDSHREHDPWAGAPKLSQAFRLATGPSAPQDHFTGSGASVGAVVNYEARAPPAR